MVLCVYAYRNCLQNARFSLLYAIDAKYHFDITFPNSFRNIESVSTQRFYIFFVLFFGGWGWGGGGYVRCSENGNPQNKPPGHPQAELGLSHMWPELGLSLWDDERFRVLKVISGLNHSEMGAAEFCFTYMIICAGMLSFIYIKKKTFPNFNITGIWPHHAYARIYLLFSGDLSWFFLWCSWRSDL